jgi:hypothetical protein
MEKGFTRRLTGLKVIDKKEIVFKSNLFFYVRLYKKIRSAKVFYYI